MRTFRRQLALVTGAASGIGRAIAEALAAEGARLVLVDIDAERLAGVANELRGRGTETATHVADMGSPDDVEAMVEGVLRRFGGLDILVNNAGIGFYGLTDQMTDEQWNRLMAVNLHGPILLVRRLLPAMLARPQAHILNVCSLAGLVGVPRLSAYQVSKFGLVGFSESLRAEYGRRGLGVTALCPGLVRTNIFQATRTTPGRALPKLPKLFYTTPERVARRALRAMQRDEGVVVVTAVDRLCWSIKRLVPGLLDRAQRFGLHARHVPRAEPLVDRFGDSPTVEPAQTLAGDDAEPFDQIIPFDAARRRAA